MNDHKVNPDGKKRVEKVINGSAKTKKKTGVAKFADNFISEDVSNIKSYVITDIIVPTIKKIISECVDTVLYGAGGHPNKQRSVTDRVSYRSYYDRDKRETERRTDRASYAYSYDDIIVDTRGEAERVLESMQDIIDMYGIVSVADLYELVGITGAYTDHRYGWTNIRTAEPIRVRDGYILKLPKALPIN